MHCEYLLRRILKAFRASIGRPLQLAGRIEILDPLYLVCFVSGKAFVEPCRTSGS